VCVTIIEVSSELRPAQSTEKTNPEKGSEMSKYRIAFVVLLSASLCNTFALAQENQGPPEQRAACAPDAFRLCASYIPDPTKVESCLRYRKSDLSDACRSVFEHSPGSSTSRSR